MRPNDNAEDSSSYHLLSYDDTFRSNIANEDKDVVIVTVEGATVGEGITVVVDV